MFGVRQRIFRRDEAIMTPANRLKPEMFAHASEP